MKKLIWAVIAILLIVYAVVVYGWIQEGNRNFNTDLTEHCQQYKGDPYNQVPSGCRSIVK